MRLIVMQHTVPVFKEVVYGVFQVQVELPAISMTVPCPGSRHVELSFAVRCLCAWDRHKSGLCEYFVRYRVNVSKLLCGVFHVSFLDVLVVVFVSRVFCPPIR